MAWDIQEMEKMETVENDRAPEEKRAGTIARQRKTEKGGTRETECAKKNKKEEEGVRKEFQQHVLGEAYIG